MDTRIIRKLSALSELEIQHWDLLKKTLELLAKIEPFRSRFRNLRVDIRQKLQEDPTWLEKDWLAGLDRDAEAAWTACRALRDELRKDCPEPIAELLMDVVRAAKELVQADHACLLGRIGCEQRWDKAMDNLKQTLAFVRE